MEQTIEKPASTTIKSQEKVTYLPFMCENSPKWSDIDLAMSLMRPEGVRHRQREIWKMVAKKDKEGKLERDDKTGAMIMVKVVTRSSKVVTVKGGESGLASFLDSGVVEPMDYIDVREVVELLKK